LKGSRLLPWIAPALAAAVFANTLGAGFTLDDVEIVRENPATRSLANLPRLFATDYWDAWEYADHTLYRPVTVATYALQHAVHGTDPAGYHLINVLLHALATGLLFLLLRDLFDPRTATIAAALFAVHAIHTEAVAGIVGRAEILALAGTLACCLAYFRATRKGARTALWAAVSVAAYLAGAMSKETGIVAPAVILATEALLPARRRLLRGDGRAAGLFAAYGAAAAAFLALRAQAVSGRSVHSALAGASDAERIATALRVAAEYVGLLFAPVGLSADYPAASAPLARGFLEPGVLAGIVLVGVAVVMVTRGRICYPAAAWGAAFFAVTFLPVSNLLFAIGVVKAERLLYAPSAGFLAAAAGLLAVPRGGATRQRIVFAGVAAAVVALGVLTWQRNRDWRDDCALAEATVRTAPASPIFLTRLAACRKDAGRWDEARALLARATEVQPGFPTALLTLGILEREQGNLPAALDPLERLLGREPDHVVALENAGWCWYRMQRFPEAAERYERLRRLRPEDPAPYGYLLGAYVAMGEGERALALAAEAERRFPGNPEVASNAAQVRQAVAGPPALPE
jgi:Flp pilus assembly protein TadD